MIPAPSHTPLADLVATGVRSEYYASAAHYQAVAKRILGALRGGHFILVTGDPPADPQALSAALGDAAGPGSSVVTIACGPESRRKDLKRILTTTAKQKTASPIFVFENFGRVSDEQIEDLCKGTPYSEAIEPPAVLLAQMDFLPRLEQPALHFLRDRIAARLYFQEVSDDETIAVVHNRLLSLQTRRIEARGFRYGVLVGVVASAAVLAMSIGALALYSAAGPAGTPPVADKRVSWASKAASVSDPVHEVAISEDKISAESKEAGSNPDPASRLVALPPSPLAPQPTTIAGQSINTLPAVAEPAAGSGLSAAAPSAVAEPAAGSGLSAVAPSAVAEPAASSRLSATAISGLVARGDAFLEAGDFASARLYYERAAEAESGPAALRMGATFDTVFTRRPFFGAFSVDPDKALFWYRRARELGIAEAEQRIKALESPPTVGPHVRSSSK
jgi:TPR repeat protein